MAQVGRIVKESKDLNGPKYRQIRKIFLEQVYSGVLMPNEPLPGERDLAQSLDVSVGTIRQALMELERDGFIRRGRGKGTFVNSPQERRELMKTNIFTLITPSVKSPFGSLVEGLDHVAAKIGYEVRVANSQNDISRQETLLHKAAQQDVAGVAIVPTTQPPAAGNDIRLLQDRQIPVVFCHRAVANVNAPLVTWSFEEMGRSLAETLIQHGHRRIVGLARLRYEFVLEVANGINATLEKHGIDRSNFALHYHGECSEDDSVRRHAVRETLERILRGKDRPTAIYCYNLFEAELVYLLASEFGISIPDDLSLIYLGIKQREGALARRLTCVARDEVELGCEAGKLLEEMTVGRAPLVNNQKIEIPLTLLPGETVAEAPQ